MSLSSSLSEQFTTLKAAIQTAESELQLLAAGKKASAPRFRKSLQNIKNQSQLLRKATTEHTKKLPVKQRIKKPTTILELLSEPTPESFAESKLAEPEPVESKLVEQPKKKRQTKSKKVLFV